MARLTLQVNGASRVVETDDPAMPLLYALRNDLGLTGAKFGCGLAQCGACTVLMGGQPVRSCLLPVSAVVGQEITTVEGLGSRSSPIPSRPPSSPSRRPNAATARPGWSCPRGASWSGIASRPSHRSGRRWRGTSAAAAATCASSGR